MPLASPATTISRSILHVLISVSMNCTLIRHRTCRLSHSIIYFGTLAMMIALGFVFVALLKVQLEDDEVSIGAEEPDEYTILENMAIATEKQFGSESGKGARLHNFTQVYARYLAPLRHKPIKLLEIGLYQGMSAKLWEMYFSRAELHFIDITNRAVGYNSTRSKYHFFNQTDENRLLRFALEQAPFDVIIDDGGHYSYQVITSFRTLFPFLNPGGIYFVEDFFTGYWSPFGGTGNVTQLGGKLIHVDNFGETEQSSVRFFKNLIDDVNFGSIHTGLASSIVPLSEEYRAKMSIYAERIDSITFLNGMCVVRRK